VVPAAPSIRPPTGSSADAPKTLSELEEEAKAALAKVAEKQRQTREAEDEKLREAEESRNASSEESDHESSEAAEEQAPQDERPSFGADDDTVSEATVAERPAMKAELSKKSKGKKGKKSKGKKKKSTATVVGYQVKDSEATKAATDGASSGAKAKEESAPKKKTTSSAVIRAITSTGEHRTVHNQWLTTPPEAEEAPDLSYEGLPMSKQQKQARKLVIVLGGIMAAALIGYWLLNSWTDYNGPPGHVMESLDTPVTAPETESAEVTDSDEEAEEEPASASEQETATEGTPSAAGDTEQAADASVAEAAGDTAEASQDTATAEASGSGTAAEETAAATEAAAEPQALDPARGAELANQAFSAMNRSRNEEARDLAQQAVLLDPTSSKAWLVLGYTRRLLGDAAGAAEAFQRCVDQGQGSNVRDCRSLAR